MPTTKAQQKAVVKYTKENYDRIGVFLPKGDKERIKARAASLNLSVNAYINKLINDDLSGE